MVHERPQDLWQAQAWSDIEEETRHGSAPYLDRHHIIQVAVV